MTATREVVNRVSLLALPVGFGLLVSVQPLLAALMVVAGLLLLTLTAAGGTNALLIATIIAFPLLPANIHVLSSSSIYPQRALLALLVLLAVTDRRLWQENSWRLQRFSTPLRFLGAFLAVGLLSAALSPLPMAALGGVGFYALHVAGALIAGMLIARRDMREQYFVAVSVAAICVCGISLIDYFVPNLLAHVYVQTFEPGQFATDPTRALTTRVSGPLGNPVALGTFSIMALPFALRATVATHKAHAWIGQAGVIALIVTIMLSQTRIAMIAAPVVIFVWLVFSDRRRQLAVVAAASAAVLILTFGVSTLKSQGDILQSAVSYRGQYRSSDPRLNSVAGRRTIYETGWRAFSAKPILGYGLRIPTGHAQSATFLRYGEPAAFEAFVVVLPLEAGVAGLVLFLGFIATLTAVAARRLSGRADRATVFAAIAGSCALALASNPFDIGITYFWLLLGIILALGLEQRRASGSRDSSRGGHRTRESRGAPVSVASSPVNTT